MKLIKLLFITFSTISFTACGQNKTKKTETKIIQKNNRMDTSKLTNETVKKAFDAWQSGDSKTFLSLFTADATMTDDGNPRNFQGYVKEACGKEIFLDIDTATEDGKYIKGNFKAGQWGTFPVFFKFHQNADGKFEKLDIGQAN
ncbi:nuclear transport factor 2 family protein [Elizabethkingia anophelis]|nr:nuclear transport factor 2 family protein [Elizabethkingia anophelis]